MLIFSCFVVVMIRSNRFPSPGRKVILFFFFFSASSGTYPGHTGVPLNNRYGNQLSIAGTCLCYRKMTSRLNMKFILY